MAVSKHLFEMFECPGTDFTILGTVFLCGFIFPWVFSEVAFINLFPVEEQFLAVKCGIIFVWQLRSSGKLFLLRQLHVVFSLVTFLLWDLKIVDKFSGQQ